MMKMEDGRWCMEYSSKRHFENLISELARKTFIDFIPGA